MNHGNPFSEEGMTDFSLQEVANMMALYNHVHGIEDQTVTVPIPEQESTAQGQESAEGKAENQTKPMETDDQGKVEKKNEHPATDNVPFDFEDLLNLTGSPDRMCDADLAPKYPQVQSSFQDTYPSSTSEMAHSSEAIPGTKSPGSVATNESEPIKQSPPDYSMQMGPETVQNQPSPPEFKDPAIPQMVASQPYENQNNASHQVTQASQAISISQPITNYHGPQAYAATLPPYQIPTHTAIPSPASLGGAWNTAGVLRSLGQDEGKLKESLPAVDPKDERANLRDINESIVLQFSSSKEANDYRPDRGPMPIDLTVPRTISEQKQCVVRLIKAMKSFECATDNWGMIKPFANRKFSDRKIEVCCWNILDCCILRQDVGPFLTPEEEALKNKTKKNKQNFTERFQDMIRILKRVDSNKSLNAKKKQAIDAGKKVMASKAADDEGVTLDEAPFTLESPFATPKHETRTGSRSNPSHLSLKTVPSVEPLHSAQQPASFNRLSPQVNHMVGMQSGAPGPLPAPDLSVVYPTHPAGNFGGNPSIGCHPGHVYNSDRGAAGNIAQPQMGTMANAPQANATSPPRSPWNQGYSNAISIAAYQIPPRTPCMPSTMSQYPTPPVSTGGAPHSQAKSACKTSRKRSSDTSDRLESPSKRGRH